MKTLGTCAQGDIVELATDIEAGGWDNSTTIPAGTAVKIAWQSPRPPKTAQTTFIELRQANGVFDNPTPVSARSAVARVVMSRQSAPDEPGSDEEVDPVLRGSLNDGGLFK